MANSRLTEHLIKHFLIKIVYSKMVSQRGAHDYDCLRVQWFAFVLCEINGKTRGLRKLYTFFRKKPHSSCAMSILLLNKVPWGSNTTHHGLICAFKYRTTVCVETLSHSLRAFSRGKTLHTARDTPSESKHSPLAHAHNQTQNIYWKPRIILLNTTTATCSILSVQRDISACMSHASQDVSVS